MSRGNRRLKPLMLVSLVVVLVALLVAATVGAARQDGLSATVNVAQSEFGASQDVLVTLTISNPTKHTVRILRWFTAGAGVEEPIFEVTRNGQPVRYVGAHFKRPAATGSDYVRLEAGGSITSTVDLGAFYDLSASGTYEIAYSVAAYGLLAGKGNASGREALASATVSVKVEGRAGKGKPTPPPPPPPGGNSFTACTTAQQSALVLARTDAKGYAANSASYLADVTQGPRYTTWFGVYDANRYNRVSSNFVAISNAMNIATVAFDCSSKRNVYAYVYPDDPYKIYLGKVYWTAPGTGTDSKAGTLIHEMSHFTVVADTDDVVYGQTGAKSLAISDPAGAVRNADSHEYFAENTPFEG